MDAAGRMAGRSILLIEDEPSIAEAIRFLLTREGWSVTLLTDGNGGLAAIRAVDPQVLVLDVMLPGRSGLDILADLRADPALASLPVLVLTAKGQPRAQEAAERAGASRFLAKPFANADLIDSVRALAGG